MVASVSTWVDILRDGVELVRSGKRNQDRCDTWFVVQELYARHRSRREDEGLDPTSAGTRADILCDVVAEMPLDIPAGTVVAGTQDGAFSPSYALINPEFRVETFAGFCDPTAIYDDITPGGPFQITRERIDTLRAYWEETPYVTSLASVYQNTGSETQEVVYFVEPVTGHTIPDMRGILRDGTEALKSKALALGTPYGKAMARSIEAMELLADRYRTLAHERASTTADESERRRLHAVADVLSRVPRQGARTLHEAVQSFALAWQIQVLEQAPNPYAFSAGNIDRLFDPYYAPEHTSRDEAVQLLRHLLTFFQVGNRCWAISQNILAGGRDHTGRDLTSPMTTIVLDAFFESNDPQPALSVRMHRNTPREIVQSLGRFYFTPGHSTPSLFNDDSVIPMLVTQGIDPRDAAEYAIAGCQEPLVCGKSSLNTTNSWLNLAKVLELACNDGVSLLTGTRLGPSWEELGYTGGASEVYPKLEEVFYRMLDRVLPRMQAAGNQCTTLLGDHMPVPFTSSVMSGLETGRDMRDPVDPGVPYSGSGCLIHGLSVVVNSLCAVEAALGSGMYNAEDIRAALQSDFEQADNLRSYLLGQQSFGNNIVDVDHRAAAMVASVSTRVQQLRNPAGKPFLADWSTPSTHLLYGYLTGATPDGRRAREMLGYGIDPRAGTVHRGFADRVLSTWKLPFHRMNGGYASHIGIDPSSPPAGLSLEVRGEWLHESTIAPLFRFKDETEEAPYYVYFNTDDATHLRDVLADPERHAPTGVYIVRIHGTFVNFLDLSPSIQEDIIRRLDLAPEPA